MSYREYFLLLARGIQAAAILLLLAGTLIGVAAPAGFAAPSNEPRDIEQVWQRPKNVVSFSDRLESATGSRPIGSSVAIVIGLSDYTHYRHLDAPWYDALRVRDALISAGFDYIVTLTNKKATKETIQHYMEDVLPDKVDKNDRFLFYFSGHGTQRKVFGSVRGYLPMLDSPKDAYSTMIGMDEIATWSANVGQSQHSLFLLDACFSGLAGVQLKGDTYTEIYLNELLRRGHFLITAGAAGQESSSSLSKWGGSLFTDAFLKGIEGEADSGTAKFPPDGIISVTKLYDYIRKRMDEVKAGMHMELPDQTPQWSDLTPKSEGEFFFLTSTGKVHPQFTPAADSSEIETKGPIVKASNGPVIPSSEKVDEIYGQGLPEFPDWRFGRSLSELSAYTWDQLQHAGEFHGHDVRYLILNIKDSLPSYQQYGCLSPTSYIVFFFEYQKFVRLSLRFFNEGACPGYAVWLNHFANAVNADIQTDGQLRYFLATGNKVQMLGGSANGLTQVDLVSTDSISMMEPKQWFEGIKAFK